MELNDGVLTIKGSIDERKREEGDRWMRREIRRGSFQRSFTVPNSLKENDINAQFRNGMLEVRIVMIFLLFPLDYAQNRFVVLLILYCNSYS